MSRTPRWLLYLVLLLIVANLIGLFVGGAFIMLVINVILVGIGGLVFIFLAARANERARARKEK